jgi:hypothetical protein
MVLSGFGFWPARFVLLASDGNSHFSAGEDEFYSGPADFCAGEGQFSAADCDRPGLG